VDWFPRTFGFTLLILAGTFARDLVRTEPWTPTLLDEICPLCIREERRRDAGEEFHRSSRCSIGPYNRQCPGCGSSWKSSNQGFGELLVEPAVQGVLAVLVAIALSIPFFGCPQCRTQTARLGNRPHGCGRCLGRKRLTLWGRLRNA